jgi:hypothetical protein
MGQGSQKLTSRYPVSDTLHHLKPHLARFITPKLVLASFPEKFGIGNLTRSGKRLVVIGIHHNRSRYYFVCLQTEASTNPCTEQKSISLILCRSFPYSQTEVKQTSEHKTNKKDKTKCFR